MPQLDDLLPTIPEMSNGVDGCYVMPREGVIKNTGLPSLVFPDPVVDTVVHNIRQGTDWSILRATLNELDSGMEFFDTKFLTKPGTNYNVMQAVANTSKYSASMVQNRAKSCSNGVKVVQLNCGLPSIQ